jgi:hypothetical protein
MNLGHLVGVSIYALAIDKVAEALYTVHVEFYFLFRKV